MRTAVEHRDPEPLRGADGDIGAQLTGRRQQGQRQQVRGDRHQGAAPVRLLDQRAQIPQHAGRPGLLHDDTDDDVGGRQPVRQVRDHEGQADRVGATAQHGERLRQALGVHDDDATLASLHGSPHQQHGLGDRGRLVQQGGAGDRQRRQVGDHGLEVEQRLQPALADLGLVGRVRRVPAGVLQHVSPDHRGRVGAVVPEPDHRGHHRVAVRDGVQGDQHLGLAPGRRQVERPGGPDRGGHRLVDQGVEGGRADPFQHPGDVVRPGADVPVDERAGGGCAGHRRLQGACSQGASRRASPLCHRGLTPLPESLAGTGVNQVPACTVGGPLRAAFQSCLAAAVRVPESFPGRVAPSAPRPVRRPDRRGLSRRSSNSRCSVVDLVKHRAPCCSMTAGLRRWSRRRRLHRQRRT